jgi:hypothetical protein
VSRAALAAGLAVAVYVACLRRYGIFDPADEGLLLVQAWRTAHGQMPYVDFHTGYGPLYFRLQSILVAAGGLAAVRWMLVLIHGAGAAFLYALARRLCGPALAAVAVALQVAFFLPVAPARGAPFNAPYPAWYAGVAGVALAVLLARPRGLRVAAAGVVCGLVFAMKPNSGVLLAAGAATAIALSARPTLVSRATLGLVALGAVVLVAPTGATLTAIALVPPVLALVALGGEGEAPGDARLALLAATFAATATVSYAPTLAALGFSHFSRDVLLVGSNVEGLYALAFPWTAVVAAIVGLAAFIDRGRHARTAAIAALGVIAVTVAGAATDADAGAGAIRRGAEVAALVAVPLVGWGTATALRRVRDAALVAPTALAVVGALQLYPRPDFLHLMPLGALLVPLALRLWRDVGLPRGAMLALPLALAAGRFAPTARVVSHVLAGGVVDIDLGTARLVVEPEGSVPLRNLGAAASAARALAPEETLLVFPACGMVPFLAGRRPAGPHDYFYPGRPTRDEVAALVARFAAAPPPLAVTCSAAGTPLTAAWDSYPEMVTLLRTRYAEGAAYPPYTVLERR